MMNSQALPFPGQLTTGQKNSEKHCTYLLVQNQQRQSNGC